MPTSATILQSRFPCYKHKVPTEQRPPDNNGLNFGAPKGSFVYTDLTVYDIIIYAKGLIHTRYFGTQYFNKKIKRY